MMNPGIAKLQGNWNITSLEVDGTTMPTGALSGARIEVEGDRFRSIAMGATYSGTVDVDTSVNPHQLALRFTVGPEKGSTNHGIFELDGSHWRLCLNMMGGPAPSTFATARGSGLALETLERGPVPVQQVLPDSTAPATELEGEWAMVSCIRDGQKLDKTMVKSARRIVRGDQLSLYFGDQLFMSAKFSIDPAKSPNTIEILGNPVQYGIYELSGASWKLCYGPRRPTEYKSVSGDGRTLGVWTRTVPR